MAVRLTAGDLLNIDFGQAGNGAFRTKTGAAAIGLSEGDYWNPFGGGASPGTGLKWSDGTESPISISGATTGQWYVWTYDAMFQSYIYGGNVTHNLTGIPAGQYDIYVYAHGQPKEEGSQVQIKVGSQTLPTRATSVAADWDKPDWTEGSHYVLFRDVAVSAGETMTMTVTPVNSTAALNGMQIVKSTHEDFVPVIVSDARHQTAIIGGSALLEPKVFGTEPLYFQWQHSGTNLDGATSRVLALSNLQISDSGLYTLTVSNLFGSTTTAETSMKVLEPSNAPLINIDLTEATNPIIKEEKKGPAAIGNSNEDFWNPLNASNGAVAALKYANGTASGAQATVIGSPSFTFSDNRDPMFLSAAAWPSGPVTVRVDGLEAARYNFLIYAHGIISTQNCLVELRVGINPFGVKGTSGAPDWNKPEWTDGSQYVRFNSITVAAGASVYITSSGVNGYAVLNGLQIIKSPVSPPEITAQLPSASVVNPGGSISFQIGAEGDGLTYQWLKDGVDIEGATASSHTISNATAAEHNGIYRVRVGDRFGAATLSQESTLSVSVIAPKITTQPLALALGQGESFALQVVAEGINLAYQWQKDGHDIAGANSATYSIGVAAVEHTGIYRVKVSNTGGDVFSVPVNVLVADSGLSLINVNFGIEHSVKVGRAAIGVSDTDYWNHYSFPFLNFGSVPNLKAANGVQTSMGLVAVNGPGQWYNVTGDPMYDSYLYSDTDITVTLTNVPAGRYNLLLYGHGITDVANTVFQVKSGAVSFGSQATTKTPAWNSVVWQRNIQYVLFEGIEVGGEIEILCKHDGHTQAFINGLQLQRFETSSPIIYQHPRSTSVGKGREALFSVVVSGESLRYQWRKDGTNLTESAHTAGVNSATLRIENVSQDDVGNYSVLVSNSFGQMTSAPAALTLFEFSLLNVNFGHESQIKTGMAATGLSSEDFWNQPSFPFSTFASMTNLQMVNRQETTVGMTVANGPGQWFFEPPTGDPMYDGYIYSDGAITVTLYNVPPGGYDLYLYGHASIDRGNSRFSVTTGNQNLGTQATTTSPGIWNSLNWQRNVQYVLFENIAHAGGEMVITVEEGGYPQAFFNGLQLRFKGEIEEGPPQISTQPKSLRISETRAATLSVSAWGLGTLQYQWKHEGTNLPTARSSTLTFVSAQLSDAGSYEVIVSNEYGSTTSSNVTLFVEGADREAPVVTITSPTPGGRPDEIFTLEGTATDNQAITSARWELNGVNKGPLAVVDGKFKVSNVAMVQHVENRVKVYAKDDFNNEGVAEVIFSWDAPRIFTLTSPASAQEGASITVPLNLISKGDVSGATFLIKFDTNHLADPVFEWSDAMSAAFVSSALENNKKQFRATFALPAVTIPTGTTTVAHISFRTRSVPLNLTSPITLELIDVYSDAGDQFTSGNDFRSAAAPITKRKVKGDNNANNRLDVGDATVVLQFLSNPSWVRTWDRAANDVNVNTLLDVGDVIKILRAVVGLDAQPIVPSASRSPLAASKSPTLANDTVSNGPVQLVADKGTALAGEKVTIEVRLSDQTQAISGASFRLEYPAEALKLENDTSRAPGPIVAAGASVLWNLSPAQNNYATQDGAISLAVSSSGAWPLTNGVLARFTFTVQSAATAHYGWPVQLKNVEVAHTTGQIDGLPDTSWTFIARDPISASFIPTVTFVGQTPQISLQGDIGANYEIEASSDLSDWVPIGTYYSSTGEVVIDDAAGAGAATRFYRAILRR